MPAIFCRWYPLPEIILVSILTSWFCPCGNVRYTLRWICSFHCLLLSQTVCHYLIIPVAMFKIHPQKDMFISLFFIISDCLSLSHYTCGNVRYTLRKICSFHCLSLSQTFCQVRKADHSNDFVHDSIMKIYWNLSEMVINGASCKLFWECNIQRHIAYHPWFHM